jgi:hypothetical protein
MSDVWFFIRDGKIIKRVENDGWAFLRDGAQAVEFEVTIEYVKKHHPAYYENYLKDELPCT